MFRGYPNNLPPGWDVLTVKSLAEIENIRSIWRQLLARKASAAPNADIDNYLAVIKAMPNCLRPHIMLLRRDAHPLALLISRVEKMQVKCRIGYKTLFKPTLNCLSVMYDGVLAGPDIDLEVYELLLGQLLLDLKGGEIDCINFNYVRTDSPLLPLLRRMPGFFCRDRFPKVEAHWKMALPASMDDFYKGLSSRHRANIKRCRKKLLQNYPDRVQLRCFSGVQDIDQAVQAAAAISEKTYQHALGAGFVDDQQTRTILETAARRGWMRIYVLFIEDKPSAYQYMLNYGRTSFMCKIGFDPQWKQYRIGASLFVMVLEDIYRDRTVDSIDFYFGDADYKRSYGTEQWQEASLFIFAPRFYPVCVNFINFTLRGLSLALARLAHRAGFIARIKRAWRNWLNQGEGKDAD